MEAATGYDLQVEVAAMKPRRHLFPRSRKCRSIHFKHSIHKGFTATFVLVVFMSPISTASLTMSSISERVVCVCAWATCTCTVDAAAGMHNYNNNNPRKKYNSVRMNKVRSHDYVKFA